jgi:ubiquinone/menaquinone biosynthesis C-methylase UbiE
MVAGLMRLSKMETSRMTKQTHIPLHHRIIELMRHLGIESGHFAACMPRDWEGLAQHHRKQMASLTLICPMGINRQALGDKPIPTLIVAGDRGRAALAAHEDAAKIAGASDLTLVNYFSPSWADAVADRPGEIGRAMTQFIRHNAAGVNARDFSPDRAEGEIAEISYRIRGKGMPLILMPLALAPSQWQPLIDELSRHFCTITLGGKHLGMVAHLEIRAQSSYMRVIDQLLGELQLARGQSLLEVGCGPGAIVRRIAARTRGANPIVAVDVNSYLMGEAAALAKREGLDGYIDFQAADAANLPFESNRFDCTISCTVMEEGDADRMLTEFVRVTKPGGKVGAVVRSTDLPRWVNVPVASAVKKKIEDAAFFSGNVTDNGCADASLYRRMIRAGLKDIAMLPQWASHQDGERLDYLNDRIVALLEGQELAEWIAAVKRAKADATIFISEPFHCAVGRKP